MKRKLYPNMKRLTSMFCIGILAVTLSTLLLRLTVFSNMAVVMQDEPASVPDVPNEPEYSDTLFPYSMNSKVIFETASSKGDFRITNPDTNEFYMTVNVIMPDSSRLNLYASGFIRPGESRNRAALHVPLDNGVYTCVAEVTAFDPNTLVPSGSEEREITLYIGEKP